MKLSHKDTPEYTAIKINLKTYNNILKRNIRQAQILYYQHQFDQYKNNIKTCESNVHKKYIASILHR